MPNINDDWPATGIAELTARIVSAYVSRNEVAPSDLVPVIAAVASGLRALGEPAAPAAAVPIDQSVSPNHVTCLLCGSKHKMLKRHLKTTHRLAPAEYREIFGLPAGHPLVAPEYADRRAQIAKDSGLGRRPRAAVLNGAATEAAE